MTIDDLTPEQQEELDALKTQDILERYDTEEYWDPQIAEDYLQELEDEEKTD